MIIAIHLYILGNKFNKNNHPLFNYPRIFNEVHTAYPSKLPFL